MKNHEVVFHPIGILELVGPKKARAYEFPFQGWAGDLKYKLSLKPDQNFEQALEDLNGFSHIWVIFWFDRVVNWKVKTVPPRGPATKRGLFATRSPHRPNPIGMTLVKLDKIEGRDLFISGGDFFDGTPVLDIKPHIPRSDGVENARSGWLENVDQYKYEVEWSSVAQKQAVEIESEHQFDIFQYATGVLRYTRDPHPYFRITIKGEKRELAVQYWRVFFRIDDSAKAVLVIEICDA